MLIKYQTRQDNKKCESESQEGANTDKTFWGGWVWRVIEFPTSAIAVGEGTWTTPPGF